jgi:hypothetical protein
MARLIYCAAFLILCVPAAALSAQADRGYDLSYHARFLPEAGYVEATITVGQASARLRLLDFNAPAARYSEFQGDGEIRRDGRRLLWQVPERGGEIRYRVPVDSKRSGAYDARMTEAWAVVRLDNLFPAARSRAARGAESRATLSLEGPSGWSFETPYGAVTKSVAFDTDGRNLDRPLGWMAAGDLGIRRTRIADRRFAIAGPRNEGFRRMDMLAFLHWTVPELVKIAPSLPDRVLIVGGSRDMWRGGLSGPNSLYVHPERPLVSGNATSTLIHELMHVAMREPPAAGDDWIVEGVAEYYSLVILLRTGAISGARFQRSMAWMRDWAKDNDGRLTDPSTGPDTARAVLLFRDLEVELAAAGGNLNAVVASLLNGRVSRERLAELLEAELGEPSQVLTRVLEAGRVPAR